MIVFNSGNPVGSIGSIPAGGQVHPIHIEGEMAI
jgi:hypothetical protein